MNIDTNYSKNIRVADEKAGYDAPKRSRYYQSMIDLQLIDKGQLYDELKRCYVIFICPFDLYGKGGIFIPLKISVKKTTVFPWEMRQ